MTKKLRLEEGEIRYWDAAHEISPDGLTEAEWAESQRRCARDIALIEAALAADDRHPVWPLGRVLAVEDGGNGALLLDGNRRCWCAARAGWDHPIPAVLVARQAWADLVEAVGDLGRLSDYDEYLDLDAVGYVRT